MAKYLIKTVETYRVANEEEAKALIEEAKQDSGYALIRYLTENREQKSKGQIVNEWKRVTLTKAFNSEKEPEMEIDINYERN